MVVYKSVRGTGFVLIYTIFRLDFEAGLAVCYFLLIHFIIELLNIVICACLCIVVSNTYCAVYLCFVCLRPVCPLYPMLPVCQFLIAPSVHS